MEKEPLEVRAQKSGYPSDAYHDPNTGMFTKPEHMDGTDKEFSSVPVANGLEIFLPKPRLKPVRKIQFATPHAFLEVIESMDRCQELVSQARDGSAPEWIAFVEPVYSNAVYVHRDKLAEACWIMEAFTDLDMYELQIAEANHIKNVKKLELARTRRLG